MEELLLKLRKLDVHVSIENDNLKLSIPEVVDETLFLEDIRANKFQIIDYIKKQKGQKLQHANIPKSNKNEAIRLTPAQARMYVLQELGKQSTAYNVPFAFEINGVLNIKHLENALKQLIQRHESLRTSFILDEQHNPVQKVEESVELKLKFNTCSQAELDKFIQEFSQPFNLEKAPLLRANLLQTAANSHVLLIDIHHIISDGLSFQVFLQDLAALYMGISLPDLTVQYRDYADWYYSKEYQKYLSDQKSFWLEELDGFSNRAILPTDFTRSNDISFEGEQMRFKINAHQKQVIDSLRKSNSASLFSVLFSIFGILQSKLTGVDDLVIGTPVAGRRHDDLKGIIGMFVNTLGIRINPRSNINFKDFLKEVSQKTLMCFDHQEYPYEALLEDLNLHKTNEINPLFNTVVALNNITQSKSKLKDFEIRPYPLNRSTAKFDLIMHFDEKEEELYGSFEYKTNLFKRETIELFFNYFSNIIDQIGENHNILLEDISLLNKSTFQEVLDLNDFTAVKYPKTETLVTLFEAQVEKTPENIALHFEDDNMTYRELNAKANQVAGLLKKEGVQRGDIVGLLTGKTFDTIIGMLGILKAGGAYLPVDITYPEQRINYILKNSKIKLLLSLKAHEYLIKDDSISFVYLDDALTNTEIANPDPVSRPNDLCYVLYTSGTTGNPKGVMIEHRNVVSLFFNDRFQFDFGEDDVWTMFHSHCFDFSVWEMYGALLNGGKLILISQDCARDPQKYMAVLQEHQVSVLNQTPTAFYNLAGEVKKQGVLLPEIRYVVFGGEALSPTKLKDWYHNHPKAKLVNMYGITEITVHASYKNIGPNEIENGYSNIGRSLPTGSLYLLDNNLKPVPKGVIGEIYVGGQGVARGYLNNEDLTNDRFLKNPFKLDDRLYKSGDLAVLLDNGELQYKGRSDNQVQLKGFRIELGEIEHHLQQNEHIQTVVVIDKHNGNEEHYLCAYWVGEKELSTAYLRNYLSERIPFYMIPSYFIQMEMMPYTSNNKIAINQLPDPTISNVSNQKLPVTNDQIDMVEIWKEHLSVNQLGITDSFFALGGDSIRAIGLISKINEKFNTSLTIGDIYTYQNIEELCNNMYNTNEAEKYTLKAKEYLENFERDYSEKGKYKDTYEAVYPMNGIEKGMVYHSLKGVGLNRSNNVNDVLYHEQVSFQLPFENFSFSTFEKAMQLIIQKHSAFRKIFDLEAQAHIVLKEISPEINFVDVSHLNEKETLNYITEKRKEEILNKTGLSLSLLWRISIIKTYSTHYFLFDFHHSLLDGWSLQSFMTELSNIYFQLVETPSYTPNDLKANYYDQILRETASTLDESNIAYWQEELKGYNRLQLPEKRFKHEQKMHLHDLKDLKSSLEAIASKYGSNLKHLCFAAFAYGMKMLSESNDITVGITTNNRPIKTDGDKLIGCFLNTLPVRIKIPEKATWSQYIEYVEQKLRDFKKHDHTPLYKVIDILDEKTNDHNPIFDVFFNYVDFHVLDRLSEKEAFAGNIDFDNFLITNNQLSVHFNAFEDELEFWFTYSTSILDEEFSIRIANYIREALMAFVQLETQAIQSSDLRSEEEKNLLDAFNSTFQSYDLNKTVLDLFKEQVKIAPDNIALVFENQSKTYKELDECSDHWAANLSSKGVRKGDIVGMLMDRSIDMVTAILSIFKLGCTYLPIDPYQPVARSMHMLSEMSSASKSNFVLTNLNEVSQKIQSNYKVLGVDELDSYDGNLVPLDLPISSDLAYVIYTSGSTGLPKGVCNTHRGLMNRVIWMRDQLELTQDSVLIQKTPYTFDVSVWELLMFTITGSKLVIAKPEGHKDPAYIQGLISKEAVELIHFVPSMFRDFLDVASGGKCKSLQQIVCSGEALPSELVEKCKSLLPWVEIYNYYGPTEAAIDVTAIDLTDIDTKRVGVSIGKPVANTQIYIVNSQNQIQPIGVPGELLIGGVQVASGYLNRKELTAKKFISNPFNATDKYNLYKTGDLAKWNSDGTITYLGRMDGQVKLNGVRIELGEIEGHLNDVLEVSKSAVMVRELDGNQHLVAYYTASGKLSEDTLRNHLFEQLPISMIPSYYVELDSFPSTSSGKLDRKSLPLPTLAIEEYVEPENEVQQRLVEIWSEILKRDTTEISITHNFFQLGGNSLKAMTLLNIVSKEFAVELSIKEMFLKQTIQAIADYIITVKQLQSVEEIDVENAKLLI